MSQLIIKELIIKNQNNIVVDLINNNEPITINSSLAIIGESGSGKSLTLKTILNMLPTNLEKIFKYSCNFDLNSNNIGFIPQNPFTSLSPMTKIYKQFFCNQDKIDQLLNLVELDCSLKNKFPSNLSGGQLQRVVIAIALSNNPKLLLLDEPTTALDDKSKQNILTLIKKLQKQLNFLVIFVTHDIDSIKGFIDNIVILKSGYIVDKGDFDNIIKTPSSSYTKQLIEANFKNREFRV